MIANITKNSRKDVAHLLALSSTVFILASFLGGCTPEFSKTYCHRQVKVSELVGIWMITEDSLPRLAQYAGFQKYTNRTDHIILLNSDGSCVYRTIQGSYEKGSEISYGEFLDWNTSNVQSKSWYSWNPNGQPVIDGPFDSKDLARNGLACKGKDKHWALFDLTTRENRQRTYNSNIYDEKYWLIFSASASRVEGTQWVDNLPDYPAGNIWSIGERNGELIIWRSATPCYEKIVPVKLTKVTEEELSKITRSLGASATQKEGLGVRP